MAEITNQPQQDPKPAAQPPARIARPKIKHLDDCPANAERVEQYDTERGNADHTTTTYLVTRCKDCGAHEAKPK